MRPGPLQQVRLPSPRCRHQPGHASRHAGEEPEFRAAPASRASSESTATTTSPAPASSPATTAATARSRSPRRAPRSELGGQPRHHHPLAGPPGAAPTGTAATGTPASRSRCTAVHHRRLPHPRRPRQTPDSPYRTVSTTPAISSSRPATTAVWLAKNNDHRIGDVHPVPVGHHRPRPLLDQRADISTASASNPDRSRTRVPSATAAYPCTTASGWWATRSRTSANRPPGPASDSRQPGAPHRPAPARTTPASPRWRLQRAVHELQLRHRPAITSVSKPASCATLGRPRGRRHPPVAVPDQPHKQRPRARDLQTDTHPEPGVRRDSSSSTSASLMATPPLQIHHLDPGTQRPHRTRPTQPALAPPARPARRGSHETSTTRTPTPQPPHTPSNDPPVRADAIGSGASYSTSVCDGFATPDTADRPDF